jgi:hypothetical protein
VSREHRFHPAARQELREAAHWYEARDAGLGAEFASAVGACLARVPDKPAQLPVHRDALLVIHHRPTQAFR